MKLLYSVFLLIFTIYTTQAQPNDSIAVSREINTVKQDISGVKRSLNQQMQMQEEILDSLRSLYYTQQETHHNWVTQLSAQKDQMDSASVLLTSINRDTQYINRQMEKNTIVGLILHGFSLMLILFLILIILVQRKRSLDYLITRTNRLAGQNDEILEKAEALQNIKKSLKEMLDNQKKANKALKKKKKK